MLANNVLYYYYIYLFEFIAPFHLSHAHIINYFNLANGCHSPSAS